MKDGKQMFLVLKNSFKKLQTVKKCNIKLFLIKHFVMYDSDTLF
jgi:hypothetical protein